MYEMAFGTQSSSKVEEGVKIFGLFLDSAQWDNQEKVLVESLPNKRHCAMPEIHFKPVPVCKAFKFTKRKLFKLYLCLEFGY